MNKYQRILLAEDDKDDYLFFSDALRMIFPSCNLIHVKNGLDCITYLKNEAKPDIIFLDLNMPYKGGLECLAFIKDNEELERIPVVIYSTSHYIKDIDTAFKNKAHYFIIKPADIGLLVDILQTLFTRLEETSEIPGKEDFVLRIAVSGRI